VSFKRQTGLWHAFRFFQDLALVYPVYVIRLQQHGLGTGLVLLASLAGFFVRPDNQEQPDKTARNSEENC